MILAVRPRTKNIKASFVFLVDLNLHFIFMVYFENPLMGAHFLPTL